MPWCPKCKDEYEEGITICADCGCELVNDLSLVEEEEKEDEEDLVVFVQDMERRAKEFKLVMDEANSDSQDYGPAETYVNNEEKAKENKASAYALLLVGSIGLAGIVLFFFDIIPTNMNRYSKYMISGVMGAFFILFLIMGFVSLRNFKVFSKNATSENNLTAEIKKWCIDNFHKDEIDSIIGFSDEISEEVRFFERDKYLKEKVNLQFMNLDHAYVNRLIEEIYPDIFE